jgi:hypothetical protein
MVKEKGSAVVYSETVADKKELTSKSQVANDFKIMINGRI